MSSIPDDPRGLEEATFSWGVDYDTDPPVVVVDIRPATEDAQVVVRIVAGDEAAFGRAAGLGYAVEGILMKIADHIEKVQSHPIGE